MALVFAESVCGLCRERVIGTAFFATSGVFLRPGDPAHPLCDVAIHASCFAKWGDRERFSLAYFERQVDHGNPYWTVVFDDDDLHVRVNPAAPVAAVQVMLAALIARPRVPLGEWDAWIAAGPDGRHPIELDAMRAVWERLRALGSAEALRDRAHRPLDEALLARVEHHRLRGLCRVWVEDELACPACKVKPCAPRFVDRLAAGEPSTVSCRRCGHALTEMELRAPLERAQQRRRRVR